MAHKLRARMQVNKQQIEMNPFVESFVSHITLGAVNSLKGVEYVREVSLFVDHDDVTIKVNGDQVELTKFPSDIIASTFKGLVTSLKGIETIENININVEMT